MIWTRLLSLPIILTCTFFLSQITLLSITSNKETASINTSTMSFSNSLEDSLVLTTTTPYTNDYPLREGFPVSVPGHVTYSSPTVVDIDNDGANELLVGTYDGEIYAWSISGTLRSGFPLTTTGSIISHLAFGDLDLDSKGDIEIVAGINSIQNGEQGNVYIWKADGTVLPGWPQSVARFGDKPSRIGSVVLADLDADNDLEVVASTNNNVVGTGEPLQPVPDLYVWDHAGNLTTGNWPVEDEPSIQGTISIGDLDSDGQLDILIGRDYNRVFAYDNLGNNLSGWPVPTYIDKDGSSNNTDPRIVHKRSAPTLADLDNDGIFEYIVAGMRKDPDSVIELNSALLVLQPDGSRHPDWETTVEGAGIVGDDFDMQQGAAIADIDGNNCLDIIIATQDGWIRAYTANQTLLWEFNYAQGGLIHATEPVIGDVDGDDLYEIIFGTHDPLITSETLTTGLWILENDGSPKFETPIPVETPGIMAAPSLADFDNDGLLEISAVTRKGEVYVWDTPSPINTFRLPWPVARHDLQRTAAFDDARFDAVKSANQYFVDHGENITYTIHLERTDIPLTYTIQLTDILPKGLIYVTGTLTATQLVTTDISTSSIYWAGRLSDTNVITITYQAMITETGNRRLVTNTATIDSIATGPFTRTSVILANPDKVYLPIIQKM